MYTILFKDKFFRTPLSYEKTIGSTLKDFWDQEKLGAFNMIRKDVQGFLYFFDHESSFPPKRTPTGI